MSAVKELSIEDIIPDLNQPRKYFDESKVKELAQSIKIYGLLQPILVKPIENDKFKIVHGERRYRACKLLGLEAVRAEVRNLTDNEVLEIQLIENLQRENLNPVEEAETFQRMISQCGYTHQKIADRIGKSREYITNKLRLLKLPDNVKQALRNNKITEGHARVLVSLNEDKQNDVLKEIIGKELNVRETEKLVHKFNGDVSRETSNNIDSRTLLVPIPSKIYFLLGDLAKKMKSKPEDLIVKLILTFVEKQEMKS